MACAGVSVTAKPPSAATVALPITVPAAVTTLTVAPASPVPVTCVPSAETVATGCTGAVRSGAVVLALPEPLPAASDWLASTRSPLTCGAESVAL
ncbi:hypothetical protein BW41_03205 [Sphingomonas sp. RIT328]|nr:hypothetical protein BW41_03205 [Sphingomonas sp. RIT328]